MNQKTKQIRKLTIFPIFFSNVFFFFFLFKFSYPFYGVQFHPEKNLYEWVRGKNIPHTKDAIKIAQYFATFFINECRKNGNHFDGVDDENQSLIYNYPAVFTGLKNSVFEQSYLFEKDIDYGTKHTNSKNISVKLV